MYAIAFTVLAIKEANLKSFKIALPVLWLLFFYDLYWVYESDVMVTVAKNIDLPLKLKFPYFEEVTNQVKFGMLGLGDIVIPGLLISLCIKYDIDSCILSDRKPKKVEEFTYPLFYSMLSAYTLSLIATYLALYYFEHPQPALVFIVPICSFALLSFSYFSKNYALWKYDSKNLTRKSSVESIG
jgi:minor histocompatibility antigen H13